MSDEHRINMAFRPISWASAYCQCACGRWIGWMGQLDDRKEGPTYVDCPSCGSRVEVSKSGEAD